MERLYKGFEIIKNNFHTSNQQRRQPKLFDIAAINWSISDAKVR
jgi:hypothetical protein